MPSITCGCGEILRYGEIPCQNEWLLISDVEFDKFSGKVEAEEVYQAMKSLIKCPSCGAVWIFWNGFQVEPQEYVPHRYTDVTREEREYVMLGQA